MTHPARLTAAQTPRLPQRWCEVQSIDGQRLYWRRSHTGYEVHPDSGRYRAELDWQPIGIYESLDLAMIACREHAFAARDKLISAEA